jgi:hypothetical protein
VQQIMEEKQKNDEVGRFCRKHIQSGLLSVRQLVQFGGRTLGPHIVTFFVLLVTRDYGVEKARLSKR